MQRYETAGKPDYHGSRDEIVRYSIEKRYTTRIRTKKCCGIKPKEWFKSDSEWYLKCEECGRKTKDYKHLYEAKHAWNRDEATTRKEQTMADKKKQKGLFEKFGEFDSVEEINAKAKELLAAGDADGVRDLAKENGQDPEETEDFINGEIPELFTAATEDMAAQACALCKLNEEEQHLGSQELMEDWVEYIRVLINEDPEVARAVRKKGKSLAGAIAALLKWSFGNQWDVPKEIITAAGIKAGRVTLGVPGMRTARKLIKDYYGGKA